MRLSSRLHRSSPLICGVLLGGGLLGGAFLGSTGCSPSVPPAGSGGAPSSGGATASGGAPSSGGTSSGGNGSGGALPGTGGSSSGGDTGAGGAGSGGDGAGGTGSGGNGSGGAPQAVFTCPPGSEAMSPNLSGTPMALPGTVPAAPGPNASSSIMEGPVWIDGALYMSQIRDYGPLNPAQILKHDGSSYTVWMPDSLTNGLALRADGMILAASHGVGGLVEIDPAASTPSGTTVIAEYMGNRLNSPNDLVISSKGDVYFTDPSFQCDSPCDDQPDNRVYHYPTGGGDLQAIATNHADPNGITLSLDETRLYVAGLNGIEVYTLDAGGAVTDGPDPFGSGLNMVDGLALDCAGNLYATAGGNINVLDPTGTSIGTIDVPNETTNVAFGGEDGTTLYITTRAEAGAYSLDVGIPGSPY